MLPANLPLNASWGELRRRYGAPAVLGGSWYVGAEFCSHPGLVFFLDTDHDPTSITEQDLSDSTGVESVMIGATMIRGSCPATPRLPSEASVGSQFYPDGYYYPEPPIIVGNYEIWRLELTTQNFYYGGALHYDKPEPVTTPQLVDIRLRSDTTNGIPAGKCADRIVSPDTLYLKCESPSLGVVTFEGNFLDRRGDFGNLFSNAIHPQYVLSAVITVVQGGRVVYQDRHQFRYFSGD